MVVADDDNDDGDDNGDDSIVLYDSMNMCVV